MGGVFDWEKTERRAQRAAPTLSAVLELLDAHEDKEAERLLDILSDRIHSKGPR